MTWDDLPTSTDAWWEKDRQWWDAGHDRWARDYWRIHGMVPAKAAHKRRYKR